MDFTTLVDEIGKLRNLVSIRSWLAEHFSIDPAPATKGSGVTIEYFLDPNSAGVMEIVAELQTHTNGSWGLILQSKMEEPIEMRIFGDETQINITEFLAVQQMAN